MPGKEQKVEIRYYGNLLYIKIIFKKSHSLDFLGTHVTKSRLARLKTVR